MANAHQIKIPNCLSTIYNVPSIKMSICNIWEVSSKKYLLVGNSNKIDQGASCRNQQGFINDTYIVDAT
jgi:hypothetical protein